MSGTYVYPAAWTLPSLTATDCQPSVPAVGGAQVPAANAARTGSVATGSRPDGRPAGRTRTSRGTTMGSAAEPIEAKANKPRRRLRMGGSGGAREGNGNILRTLRSGVHDGRSLLIRANPGPTQPGTFSHAVAGSVSSTELAKPNPVAHVGPTRRVVHSGRCDRHFS